MSDDAVFVSFVVFSTLFGGGVIWLLQRAHRRDPVAALLRRKTPTPRKPWRRTWFLSVKLAKWQASVKQGATGAPPDIGPHLLTMTANRAVIRGGAENYMRRKILFLFVLIPIFGVSILQTAIDVIEFFVNGAHRGFVREVLVDGESRFEFATYEPTIWNFILSIRDDFGLYFGDRALERNGGFGGGLLSFLGTEPFFLLLLLLSLAAFFLMIAHRVGAPLVFDRERGLIYTVHRGHIHAVNWRKAETTFAWSGRVGSPAFALSDIEGTRGPRWFALAAWGGFGAKNSIEAADGMLSWLVRFMDGRSAPAGAGEGVGPIVLIAPREGKLPADLEARLDRALPAARSTR